MEAVVISPTIALSVQSVSNQYWEQGYVLIVLLNGESSETNLKVRHEENLQEAGGANEYLGKGLSDKR